MLVKNNDVSPEYIKSIRKSIQNESKTIRKFLGIDSTNLIKCFPIYKRDFSVWVYLDKEKKLIGTITFEIEENDIAFIKIFYIFPDYRKEGYGLKLLKEFLKVHPKVKCKIDEKNKKMHRLVEKVGIKGEKRRQIIKSKKLAPIWYSNYLEPNSYV